MPEATKTTYSKAFCQDFDHILKGQFGEVDPDTILLIASTCFEERRYEAACSVEDMVRSIVPSKHLASAYSQILSYISSMALDAYADTWGQENASDCNRLMASFERIRPYTEELRNTADMTRQTFLEMIRLKSGMLTGFKLNPHLDEIYYCFDGMATDETLGDQLYSAIEFIERLYPQKQLAPSAAVTMALPAPGR